MREYFTFYANNACQVQTIHLFLGQHTAPLLFALKVSYNISPLIILIYAVKNFIVSVYLYAVFGRLVFRLKQIIISFKNLLDLLGYLALPQNFVI